MIKTTIAIDLGGTHVRVARISDGIIEKCIKEKCNSKGDENDVLQQICKLIDAVINESVQRIGVGVPSVVDCEKGIVYDVQNIPSWKEVHLKSYLENIYHLPVVVDNDVNCFVLGEKVYGVGKNYKNVVGITLGTGVGAGIICNGEIYRGTNTGAGEIGCLPYLDSDYEHYCSSQWMKKQGVEAEELSLRASQGDGKAIALWQEFGKHLGKLMQAILFTYDPDAIIIGGGIAAGSIYFMESMKNSMHEGFPYQHEADNVQILISQLPDCNLFGASEL
jgi:glucokinase